MVDTRDLKSLGQECLYGFESRPKHFEGWQERYTVILFHKETTIVFRLF